MSKSRNSITDVPGIRAGHAQDLEALTGCTVILCPQGVIGGVDQRGGSPGTRETDALRPMHRVNEVHAVLLTGGSAFGLNAAAGVMRYLKENNTGFKVGKAHVPIVPAAVIFDLGIGGSQKYPDDAMGYEACLQAASSDKPLEQGNFGAGAGATVGKILGLSTAMKSGIGTASIEISSGLWIGAIFVVNVFGDVIDPSTGEILAGARTTRIGPFTIGGKAYFADTQHTMRTFIGRRVLSIAQPDNTVIGVVATNARLNKEQINKVAQMAHDGIARTIRPAHTMLDGDTIFSIATNKKRADVNIIGAFAADVTAAAIINAIKKAEPAAGLPSFRPAK
jgi:L-aminopeptidase/D-esterase-like protein